MFRASSAHLQEDTVVYMQHMVLSLSTIVLGALSVHSLSENWELCTDRPHTRQWSHNIIIIIIVLLLLLLLLYLSLF